MATGQRKAEFRRGWPVVLAAALGSGLGVSGLLTYNSGLFLLSLEREIGLSRGQFGAIFFASTIAMALALPFCGRSVDRRGPFLPTLVGAAFLALGFVALAFLTRSIFTYAAIMIGIGLLAVGSTPVAYTRAVSARFDRARGLALGLTQVGIGLSAAIVPPLVGLVIARQGWPSGYLVLAFAALLGMIPSLWVFGRFDHRIATPATGEGAESAADFANVLKSRAFRLQLAAFVVMAVGFAGLLPHFVPMLVDSGLAPPKAAALAGLIGLSVIVSRIIVGYLADLVNAPVVAAAACAICAAGLLTLAVGGPALAPVAAIALGCAMGAEADLIGFLTARYFGIAVYGRAYAVQYAAFILAAGAGPMWVGYLADWTGDYRAASFVAAGLLVVAILLFLALPPTRRETASDAVG